MKKNLRIVFKEYVNRVSNLRTPIEWRDPYIYLMAFFQVLLTCYYSVMGCASCVCFPVAVCSFLDSFGLDIRLEMISLNDLNHKERSSDEFYKRLCHIIEFHSTVRRLNGNVTYQINNLKKNLYSLGFHQILLKFSSLSIQHILYGRLHQFAIHCFYSKWNSLSSSVFYKILYLE